MEALIEARIERAVVAIEDPNPVVSGQGSAPCAMPVLRWSWVSVQSRLSRIWRGSCCACVAVTAASPSSWRLPRWSHCHGLGESQWITGPSARQDVQRLRAEADVIVTGIGTVLADDCRLTCARRCVAAVRGDRARALAYAPARMVLDSRARTPLTARILEGESTTIVTTVTTRPGDFGAETEVCQPLRMLKAGLH